MRKAYNKLFKSDSQRVAFLLCVAFLCLRCSAEAFVLRCSHLNRALCALEKIMKKWLLIMLASFSSVVSAENESLDCKNAMNTFEINQCASMALDSAQAELTKYLEASFEHNVKDPDLVSAIQVAQKDWQSYMSSHCNSVYTQWRDGSIRGVLAR